MPPDYLLRRYPAETVRWLRGRLGLTQLALALRIGATPGAVRGWEAGRRRIPPPHHRRLVPLLAPHLATAEGRAFARSLGRGEAAVEALELLEGEER